MGLTRSQWQTLAYLANHEGIHQAGLAEMLEIEPITLVRILDKLTERGWSSGASHPNDRRIWLLYLCQETRPLLKQMRDLQRGRSDALKDIPPEERDCLFKTLTLMKSNLLEACHASAGNKETHYG